MVNNHDSILLRQEYDASWNTLVFFVTAMASGGGVHIRCGLDDATPSGASRWPAHYQMIFRGPDYGKMGAALTAA